jgi:anti-anti-sigma regulatory factor
MTSHARAWTRERIVTTDHTRWAESLLSEARDGARSGWVVLTVREPLDTQAGIKLLGDRLLDLLFGGVTVITVDLTNLSQVPLVMARTLVAGADLLQRCDGVLVVSARHRAVEAQIRAVDLHRVAAVIRR